MKKIFFLLLLLCGSQPSLAQTTANFYDNQNRLLANLAILPHHHDQIGNGNDNNNGNGKGNDYIALQLELARGWKTYSNRKDSGGLPPEIDISDSLNIKTIEIFYPPDREFSFQGIKNHGYEDKVIFPIKITPLDKNKNILLNMNAVILVCDIICIPAKFSLQKNIPPFDTATENPTIAKALKKSLPNGQINNNNDKKKLPSFAWYIFLAFLGGLTLNILPCVLPALSLKLRALQTNKKKPKAVARKSIIITAFGLFSFFTFLGLVFYILRETGRQFFWGVYFQSPLFVGLLLLLFVIIFLLSLKNFSLTPRLPFLRPLDLTRLATINTRHPHLNDFALGFFMATLSASCLAPMMSLSLTFAFNQPNALVIPLFLSVMGFGLALPWVAFAFLPRIIQWRLPTASRGIVIRIFNSIVAIALFAVILWLTSLLKNTIGVIALLLPGLLFATLIDSKKIHAKNNLFFLLLIGLLFAPAAYRAIVPASTIDKNLAWENFGEVFSNQPPTAIASQVAATNRPTLLVITADWCLTCQINTKGVFASPKFAAWVDKNNIRLLLADWTKPNQAIADFIAAENRVGIPLTIFYNGDGEKKILPELLSFAKFYDAVANP